MVKHFVSDVVYVHILYINRRGRNTDILSNL